MLPHHGGMGHGGSTAAGCALCPVCEPGFKHEVGDSLAFMPPSPVPRVYFWRQHEEQRLISESTSTLDKSLTQHTTTTCTAESAEYDARSSLSTRSAPTTPTASMSELPSEKNVSRLYGGHRGLNGAAHSEGQMVTWNSYSAAAGTFILLGCFAVLATSFVSEKPPLFEPHNASVPEYEDGNHHGPVKGDSSDPILAGSRNLIKRDSSGRPLPRLFPYTEGSDSTLPPQKPRHPDQWDDPMCWTQPCLAEGTALTSSLDPSVNPCDDFYAHVCNRWSHERPLPRGHAVASVDLELLDVFTLDAFNVLGRESANMQFNKLRLLLQACVASPEHFFPKLAHEALQSVALAGWPYDHDVDADAVSLSTTLGRMVTAFDLDPLFGLTLTADPASESGMKVTFAFAGPQPVLNEGIEDGREYSFVRQAFDHLVEAIKEKSLHDPIETDVQLAAVFVETSPMAANALKLKNCTRKLVGDLPELGDWLFWDKLFAELVQGGINETEVLLPDPALFTKLNRTQLLSARGSKSRMANYLGFRVLLLVSPFGTGADDTNVPASLEYAIHRNYPTSLHDYQACLRFVNRYEPVVATRRLHGHWKERLARSEELVQMVAFLRAELSTCLKTSSLIFTSSTAGIARALLDFLSGLSWQVLNPEIMEHTWTFDRLSSAYERLNASDARSVIGFLQSVVQTRRDATSDFSVVHWKGGFLSTTASLAFPYKVLEVPLPVFSLRRALDVSVLHLQLARIGPRVYHTLYKALYFTSTDLALDNMTWNPLRYFETAADCLWEQYSTVGRKVANSSSHSSLPSANTGHTLDNLFDALALSSSFDAYWFYVTARHKLYRFKGSENLDMTRAFFVEYARNFCESRKLGLLAGGSQLRTSQASSPAWYKVNGPLMNTKEFAKAFSCPPGSLMNPTSKCPLIRKHR
ncbi:neprilysin-2-like isoform X2 [Dermacentor albipictus]|uniref:neprilysin-2-like isoform X2 n=1 Tax=Dermacentor albipictus TaxID=60249 RepID=UPI0031FD1B8F